MDWVRGIRQSKIYQVAQASVPLVRLTKRQHLQKHRMLRKAGSGMRIMRHSILTGLTPSSSHSVHANVKQDKEPAILLICQPW